MMRTLGAALFIASASPALAQPLVPPFAQRGPYPSATDRPCAAAPEAVGRFSLVSKYGQAGSRRDAVDDDAEAQFEKAMAPIKEFTQGVVRAANDYHRTGRVSAARCALGHLAAWARADALAGPESHTAWFKLATTLSGLSLAYLQVRPGLDTASDRTAQEMAAVEGWLVRRGGAVAGYFETLKTPRSSRNNHRAWAGLATASAAVAGNDRALLVRGLESYRIVICEATAEGALPLELERGRKAAEYHLYALAALVSLAEIGQRNGHGTYALCDGALTRSVRFTLAALDNPSRVAALAGAAQDDPKTFATASRLVFIEPWLARHPANAAQAKPWLGRRPLGLTDLGGNQTLLYGVRP